MEKSKPKRGVLLVNLGSPDSTEVSAVRKYLHQFLMDEKVIDSPYLIRKFVVCCFILPKRPKESAHAYRTIWTDEGSPLIVISQKVKELVQERVDCPVGLGMRYGNPSSAAGIRELLGQSLDLEEILLIPLYPHYAASSYETAVMEVEKQLKRIAPKIRLQVKPPFYDDPDYIEAMVASASEYLKKDYDHILFSYHGLPERHMKTADPTGKHCLQVENCCSVPSEAHQTCYRHQVFRTTELFVEKAGIPKDKYSISFQSRLGREPWLKPYTDLELERLPKEGVKRILVICPAFVSDCLETLEEIGIRGRESFIQAGGEEYEMIPCMNTHPRWIETLVKWCQPEA
ncbi:MAG: ferrochelatase [Candidatus Omnitrophica bacterium]|nr:ferrochelatase [Candidatus Omnitrophota bacterium]MCB9784975.1 ferrochelatase [Candidatus Omnitrophota bacterium]